MNNFKNPVDALEEWSLGLDKKWLKFIVDGVLFVKRELIDLEISEIYKIFLEENNLNENSQENSANSNLEDIVNPKDLEKKFEVGKSIGKLILKKLLDVEKVNALAKNQEILFHPKLTIIFGYNATGKSGYVRILKRVSKSRTSEDVWSDIYNTQEKNVGKAKFIVDIDNKEKEIFWNGESEVYPLDLIDVFDNKCVKVFLTNELTFGFKPYGFELFSIISNAINQLKELLESDILKRKKVVDFSIYFNAGTQIFKIVKQLSPYTHMDEIEKLAGFSGDDLLKLESKKTDKISLATINIEDKIKIINNEKNSLENLKSIILDIKCELSITKIQNYNVLVKKYLTAKKNIESKKIIDLTKYKIPLQETNEWDDFIRSAENYIKKLPQNDRYPSSGYECIYCRQKLSEDAIMLIKRYRSILESQEEIMLKNCLLEVDIVTQFLNNKSFSLNFISKETENILNNLDKPLFDKIKKYCELAESLREKLVNSLINKKETESNFILEQIIEDKLVEIINQKETFIAKLKGDVSERVNRIEELDAEINELTDSKTLKDKKDQVLKYLEDLKWVQKAEELNRLTTTRSVTDLSKKVWENLITDDFKRKFDEERNLLQAPIIEFVFPSEYGIQKRCKSLSGLKNIDDFLSEGEQKAIALADFLAEISLKTINAPLVFDDPVTSFDHIRRRVIAQRLCEESQKRQVVIFTHDILFLSYLKECCENDCDVSLHWIEKGEEGVYGRVSLNDCPLLDSYDERIKKVENCIQNIQTLSGSVKEEEIMKGFSLLRASYESFVIEKIFKKVVLRWKERIQMLNLKKVIFDEELLVEVQNKFEELSLYVNAHIHSDLIRQEPPDDAKLKNELNHLKKLTQSLKSKQK